MNRREGIKVTTTLIAVTIVVWVLWDLYVALNGHRGDTESEVIRTFSNRHFAFPLIIGIVMGHFFWNVATPISPWWSRIGLPIVGLTAIVVDYLKLVPWINPGWPFLAGIILGRLLWPQMIKPF